MVVESSAAGACEVNASPNYNSVNLNKRSLCLDLKSEAGREILRRLVAESDILMENYTPQIMARFGLDYAALSKVNPALVMTSFSSYGKTGPLSAFKANGTSIEAMSGWDYFHRYVDNPPMVMGFYQADAITGLQMAATTLVALVNQRKSGRGQAIDGSMYEAATGYLGEALLEAQFDQQQTGFGNNDADVVPNNVFACSGEDNWLAISIRHDEEWQRLVATTGLAELADSRFDTLSGRREHQAMLETLLSGWTATHDAQHLMNELQAAGIAAAVVTGFARSTTRTSATIITMVIPGSSSGLNMQSICLRHVLASIVSNYYRNVWA